MASFRRFRRTVQKVPPAPSAAVSAVIMEGIAADAAHDFLDLTEHGFFETDSAGILRFVNERFAGLMGPNRLQLIGEPIQTLIRPTATLRHGPISGADSLLAIDTPLEVELIQPFKSTVVLRLLVKAMRDQEGRLTGYRGAISDITKVRALTRTLVDQAHSDMLTGVGNRRAFHAWVQSACDTAIATSSAAVIAVVDIDRFAHVNDTLGNNAGDAVLVQMVRRLRTRITEDDKIARLNGDEFGIVFCDGNVERAIAVCDGVLEDLKIKPFEWDARTLQLSVSFGLAETRDAHANAADLLRRAGMACAQSKDDGRSRVTVARAYDDSDIAGRDYLSYREIEMAMESHRLHIVAMPIARISAKGTAVHHHEVLVRLRDGDGKLQAPGQLIASAERLGIMPMLDKWIINRTVELLTDTGGMVGINVNINLSGQSLGDAEFANWLLDRIDQVKFWPGQVCFEITETSVVRNMQTAFALLQGLRDRGCRVALDDFGSGLASFAYLMKFEADFLKIDGSIVANVANDPTQRACVTAIVGLAKAVRAETVAEFVKDEATLNILRSIGVDYAQGHHVGMPVDLSDVAAAAPLKMIDLEDLDIT